MRLARAAGYTGILRVQGWGVGGVPGREQRAAYTTEQAATVGDFEPGLIRVWLPCSCSATEFYEGLGSVSTYVLEVFAHELGHYRQHLRGREMWTPQSEAAATRYGCRLLRAVPL